MKGEISLNGIHVDLDALSSIQHRCEPARCLGLVCCCSSYEICVGKREMSVITDYMPLAAHYAKGLKNKDGFKNVFEQVEKSEYVIDTDKSEKCVFSFLDKKKGILCSLHTVAIREGARPEKVKPKSCSLWPLAISKPKPTLLSVSDDAFSFPCNTKRRSPTKGLDESIKHIIKSLFGDSFFKQLESKY